MDSSKDRSDPATGPQVDLRLCSRAYSAVEHREARMQKVPGCAGPVAKMGRPAYWSQKALPGSLLAPMRPLSWRKRLLSRSKFSFKLNPINVPDIPQGI